jgi:hypothetical protein
MDRELDEAIGQLEIFGSIEKKLPHADSRDFGGPGAPSALKANLSVFEELHIVEYMSR